jgi:hypothetical protein
MALLVLPAKSTKLCWEASDRDIGAKNAYSDLLPNWDAYLHYCLIGMLLRRKFDFDKICSRAAQDFI